MTSENENNRIQHTQRKNIHYRATSGDAVYGLGAIGAAIFFIGQATTFWMGVLGLLKAFIWPVILVLEALKALL